METKWNDEEYKCLHGLSLLAQVIYLQVFRRQMNFVTGIAGTDSRIFYQSICDCVGFVPDLGSHEQRWIPTKSKVRAAIRELERARPEIGRPIPLLIDMGNNAHGGYIKKLPLASVYQSAQKRNDAGTTQFKGGVNDAGNDAENTQILSVVHEDDKTEPRDERHAKKFAAPAMNVTSSGNREEKEKRVAKATVELRLVSSADQGNPSDAAGEVFAYWKTAMGHARARLDAKRKGAIERQLRAFSREDLCRAIDGCRASAWHQGKNDRKAVYDDIGLICRDAAHVERFMALAGTRQASAAELHDWLDDDRTIEGSCEHVR